MTRGVNCPNLVFQYSNWERDEVSFLLLRVKGCAMYYLSGGDFSPFSVYRMYSFLTPPITRNKAMKYRAKFKKGAPREMRTA